MCTRNQGVLTHSPQQRRKSVSSVLGNFPLLTSSNCQEQEPCYLLREAAPSKLLIKGKLEASLPVWEPHPSGGLSWEAPESPGALLPAEPERAAAPLSHRQLPFPFQRGPFMRERLESPGQVVPPPPPPHPRLRALFCFPKGQLILFFKDFPKLDSSQKGRMVRESGWALVDLCHVSTVL